MAQYKISDIEGIGATYSEKMKKAGIRSVNALLEKGSTRRGRKDVAQMTGIDESLILKWVNMADLYRVKGIGSEYSELLEKAGVDTVKELATRNAVSLYSKILDVNSSGKPLVRQLPALKQVQAWIDHARKLDPKVTY